MTTEPCISVNQRGSIGARLHVGGYQDLCLKFVLQCSSLIKSSFTQLSECSRLRLSFLRRDPSNAIADAI